MIDNQIFQRQRAKMVEKQIHWRGIQSEIVLSAMQKVPRHKFVPNSQINEAYEDRAMPIGFDQTISQPYIVALMTSLLDLQAYDRVLEIGTGCGYQTAILAQIVNQVYTIELIDQLAQQAWDRLTRLGYENIAWKVGNGYLGWVGSAPFDRIIVTAAPPTIPPQLIEQLRIGGKMILPVGLNTQELVMVTRLEKGIKQKFCGSVRFVPMKNKPQD